jgi:hypothetical protein
MRLVTLLPVLLCGCQGVQMAVEAKTLLWEVRVSVHNGDSGRRATDECVDDCGTFASARDAIFRN